MGAFIVNVNVRSQDRQAVERAVAALNPSAAWVTDPKNGWVTVYDEEASTQDDRRIRELSEHLSDAVGAPAIAFLVHDSDFVCYWLCDGGRVIDEFNSCPDYFGDDSGEDSDEDGDPGERGGRPEVLVKYCAQGKQLVDVERVLRAKRPLFADEQLAELAGLLGIDEERAIADFMFISAGEVDPAGFGATFVGNNKPGGRRGRRAAALRLHDPALDDDDEDTDDGPPPGPRPAPADMLAMLQGFGLAVDPAPADPQIERLVQAAADNDTAEIDRLVAAGVDIDGTAVLRRPADDRPQPLEVPAGRVFSIPVTPLHAALGNKQVEATRRLIELGADVKASHPIAGTPVHTAVLSGNVDLLRLVLDGGGDPNALNARGQTPLQALQHFQLVLGQLAQGGVLGAALRGKAAGQVSEHLKKIMPSAEAFAACEQLLRERAGQK
jgi:hypothetical protein